MSQDLHFKSSISCIANRCTSRFLVFSAASWKRIGFHIQFYRRYRKYHKTAPQKPLSDVKKFQNDKNRWLKVVSLVQERTQEMLINAFLKKCNEMTAIADMGYKDENLH